MAAVTDFVVMWTEIYDTNSDQKVIACYLMDTETRIGGCAQPVQVCKLSHKPLDRVEHMNENRGQSVAV